MTNNLAIYEHLMPLLEIGVWEHDLIKNSTYFNNATIDLLEADGEQSYTLDRTIDLHRHPETIHKFLLRVQNSGVPETIVSQLTTFKGNVKWVRMKVMTHIEQGKCIKIYGTLEDITQQVNLISKLQNRDQRFTQAFNHAPNGMALVLMEGNFTKVNLSLCNILGWEKKLLLLQTYQELVHHEDLEVILNMLSSLIALEKRTAQAEIRFRHRNGHFLWMMLNVSIVHDDMGKPSYMIFQLKNIDERIKNQQIISAQNNRLQNFAHIISHNLRSYGSNINALAEMALYEDELEEKNQLITMLKITSGRLLETLQSLNDIVKEQQQHPIHTTLINVKQEIERAIEILSVSISQADAVIEVNVPPQEQITFNPAYFESIIINLITNAIKYKHPARKPFVQIQLHASKENIQLSVSDNGIGIDLQANKESIFGLYETFNDHPDSRGVGLYLVKQQIEELGGSIAVESKLDHGTKFTLQFPN